MFDSPKRLRQIDTVLSAVFIIFVSLCLPAGWRSWVTNEPLRDTGWLPLIEAATPIWITTAVLSVVARVIVQKRIKRIRNFAVEKSKDDLSNPIALFCRPFFTDGLISVKRHYCSPSLKHNAVYAIAETTGADFYLLEDSIIEGLEPIYNLVRIGDRDPAKAPNNAHVMKTSAWKQLLAFLRQILIRSRGRGLAGALQETDDSWFVRFQSLVRKADLIIVVPLAQPATLAEIREIYRLKLLDRTVFVMPFDFSVEKGAYSPDPALTKGRDVWNHSARILRDELGIDLPDYNKRGGIVVPYNGRWTRLVGSNGKPWETSAAIRKILSASKLRLSHRQFGLGVWLHLLFSVPAAIFGSFVLTALVYSLLIVSVSETGPSDPPELLLAVAVLTSFVRGWVVMRRFGLDPAIALVIYTAILGVFLAGLCMFIHIAPDEISLFSLLGSVFAVSAVILSATCAAFVAACAMKIWRSDQYWQVSKRR